MLAHGWLTACRVVPGADAAPGLSSQATYTPNISCILWARKAHAIYVDLVAQCQLTIFSMQEHCLGACWLPEDVSCYGSGKSAAEDCGLAEEAHYV